MNNFLKIGLFNATGRVGKLLFESLLKDESISLSAIYARNSCFIKENVLITNDINKLLDLSDVIIDFSSPQGLISLINAALNNPKPIVTGTTGLNDAQKAIMLESSAKMPILHASNMSRGISVLNKLIKIAAQKLVDSNIEIIEMHHKHKKDSPSGTALMLANTCIESRGLSRDNLRLEGRSGIIRERCDNEICLHSLRGGDVVGKHVVGFYLDGEYLELSHTATNRMTFVNGAIAASKWIFDKPNALYSIEDVL